MFKFINDKELSASHSLAQQRQQRRIPSPVLWANLWKAMRDVLPSEISAMPAHQKYSCLAIAFNSSLLLSNKQRVNLSNLFIKRPLQ